MPERIMLEVYVDLDPIPGEFHSKENARMVVQQILRERIPHYHPNVDVNYQE